MSQEKARQWAQLWLRQAQDDFQAASMLHQGGQAAQACFLAQQVGEKALKALLRELGGQNHELWQREARLLDKLYAPTLYPDALGDEAPVDVFGPEDGAAALGAAERLMSWARQALT
jgi:HEPN domain-containing protein